MTHGRQQRGLFAAIDFKQPAKELDRLKGTLDGWVKHQPPAMEVALVTAAGGAQGAFLGGVMGVMTAMDPSGAGKLLSQPPPGSNPQASPAPTPPPCPCLLPPGPWEKNVEGCRPRDEKPICKLSRWQDPGPRDDPARAMR